MTLTTKCKCGGNLKYCFTAQKSDHIHKVYQCLKCGETVEDTSFRYNPTTCPKHHWEFESWKFEDSPYEHKLYWQMKCDRCGATSEKRWDSHEVGLRQAVDPEDPRVTRNMAWDKQSVRFLLPEEDRKNFWS